MTDTSDGIDRAAEFERIVLPLKDRMMRTVWRVTRDPELAEDAFQEALVTIWTKLPIVRAHPNPQALVLRICLNAACDQARAWRRRQHRTAPLEASDAKLTSSSPTHQAELAEQRKLVLGALSRLKPRQAKALLLRALHQEPYAAIAEALGCSEPTARVHVLRARERLRLMLTEIRAIRVEETKR